MTRYQVTAKFGNIFEVVGADEVDEVEAYRLFNMMRNAGREVHVHRLTQEGSRLVDQA